MSDIDYEPGAVLEALNNKADRDLKNTEVDIEQMVTDITTATLSSKANQDMDNLTTTGKETIVALGIPDYDAGVSLTSGSTYTAPCDGIVRASGNGTNSTTQIYCPDDSTTLATTQTSGYFAIWAFVNKGRRYKVTGNQGCVFFPLKGVNNA